MASKTLTIEVGNEFIKICNMQMSKGNVMVHNAISVQTPIDSVEDGLIRDVGQVAGAIRSAMAEEQISANEVTFVLNSSRVATKEVILPLVKENKIQELINMNATEYFPVNIDDYVLSYTVLEEKKSKDEQKLRVLVFAAPELMVKSYYDLANSLGMKIKAVDYAGNSTLQLIKIQIDTRPTMVVQLGMDTTIVSVMNNNVLQLQRTIPYGESLLLNQVMETRNVKAKVAMELLSSAQIVKDNLDADETTGSLKYLISNVNRVIEYYSSRNQEAPLQKIVIIGEGADVLGMDVLFANETSLPAERLTLLKRVESYNRIKISTSLLKQYMANVGASLNPIHLQPKAAMASKKSASSKKNYTIPCAIAMLVMVGAAVGLAAIPTFKLNSKTDEKEKLEKQINELRPRVEKADKEKEESDAMCEEVELFNVATLNDTMYTLEMIEYLEKEMPTEMGIEALAVDNGHVNISVKFEQPIRLDIILDALEKNEHIYNVVASGYNVSAEGFDPVTDQVQKMVTSASFSFDMMEYEIPAIGFENMVVG